MSDYDDKAVENTPYCMPSMQKRNVEQMNNAMGYHDMSDLANTKPFPVNMTAAKRNSQLDPKIPAPNKNGGR